jgi:DNA invertase Pin-like site-specific DNA recombinase
MTDNRESLVTGLIKLGHNDRTAAEETGLTRHQVRSTRRRLGLAPNRTHKKSRISHETAQKAKLARAMRNQGRTFASIAKEFGVSRQAVHEWLKKGLDKNG